MSTETLNDPLLEIREVAAYLKVSPPALEKWRLTGKGPAFIRIGRLIRYRRSDLDRWLAEQTVGREAVA